MEWMGWGWGRWVKACDGCFEGDYAGVLGAGWAGEVDWGMSGCEGGWVRTTGGGMCGCEGLDVWLGVGRVGGGQRTCVPSGRA